jgi:beta-glucanase (GH16 family)
MLLKAIPMHAERMLTPMDTESAGKEKITFTISAGSMYQVSDGVELKQNLDKSYTAHISEGENWLSFDANVPESGRYHIALFVNTQDTENSLWIEDYIDNKDDRTYNITGNINSITAINTNEFQQASKTGSPLKKGIHKMKLHTKGKMRFSHAVFTLIKPHQTTPKVLTQSTEGSQWKMVWSDEFEKSGLPDTTKWTYDIGDWGWGNNELQFYTEKRAENARVEDGNLIIEARKNDNGYPWTSARLTTRGKVAFVYGKIEFRAKVPAQKGNWAAGWTLGDSYMDELSWPYCGEIDILESVGYEMDDLSGNGKAHASVHCGNYYFKLGNQPTGIIEVSNMQNEYHIYAVEWSPQSIKAFVDGKQYLTYNDTSSAMSWPFNEPQNIILNLTMGGGWGGQQGIDESVISQKYIIDYVRVYEKVK